MYKMAPTEKEREWRSLLVAISHELGISDVGSMKFVCRDVIPAGLLDRISNEKPYELLEILEEKAFITPTDTSYLKEIFIAIRRRDLAEKIPVPERKIGDEVDGGSYVPPPSPGISKYRELLNDVADDLDSDDVGTITFLLNIPKGKRSQINDGQGLLCYMEKKAIISENNLEELKEVLHNVHRNDIIKKINKFISDKDNASLSQPPQLQPPPPSPLMKPSDFEEPAFAECAPPQYLMKQKPFGYALLINNEKFTERTKEGLVLNERLGTEKDLANLKELWKKLGFVVECHENLKAHRIVTVVQDMATKINQDAIKPSCFVCCIMSHGKEGSIYGEDSKEVAVIDLIGFFKETRCQALIEKPKLFFIQACRGRKKLKTISTGGQLESGDINTDATPSESQDEMCFRHNVKLNEFDFLIGYSTLPGYVCYRSTKHGSWYISAIVEIFNKYYQTEDLMTMMVRVNEKVSEAYTKEQYKQCPAPVITLRKKIFFQPG